MTVGEKIKKYRLEHGFTLEDVAAAAKTSRQNIHKYESGLITNIPPEKIEAIANLLRTTPADLMGWEEEPEKKRSVKIPVLGRVAAGIPIDAIETIDDWEEIDGDMARHGNYFALRIKGESMMPRICDGDVVIVRQQPTCENGDIVIVTINGDEATCKKIMLNPDGSVTLISFNPAYNPMFFSKKEVASLPLRILGRVVELRGKF